MRHASRLFHIVALARRVLPRSRYRRRAGDDDARRRRQLRSGARLRSTPARGPRLAPAIGSDLDGDGARGGEAARWRWAGRRQAGRRGSRAARAMDGDLRAHVCIPLYIEYTSGRRTDATESATCTGAKPYVHCEKTCQTSPCPFFCPSLVVEPLIGTCASRSVTAMLART